MTLLQRVWVACPFSMPLQPKIQTFLSELSPSTPESAMCLVWIFVCATVDCRYVVCLARLMLCSTIFSGKVNLALPNSLVFGQLRSDEGRWHLPAFCTMVILFASILSGKSRSATSFSQERAEWLYLGFLMALHNLTIYRFPFSPCRSASGFCAGSSPISPFCD